MRISSSGSFALGRAKHAQTHRTVRHKALLAAVRADDGRQAGAQTFVGHLERAPGGGFARGVGVQGEDNLFDMPVQEPQVTVGDGRSQRGDHIAVAMLVRHRRVHVALDDHHLALLSHRLAGQVKGKQRFLLVKEERVSRVEVLGGRAIFQ